MDNLHKSLTQENLSPEQHFVDSAYIDTELLISSQQNYGIELIGPIQKNPQWQAKEGKGYSLADFKVNWAEKIAQCPHGKFSKTWKNRLNSYQQSVIQVSFKKSDCQNCPAIDNCTKSKSGCASFDVTSSTISGNLRRSERTSTNLRV